MCLLLFHTNNLVNPNTAFCTHRNFDGKFLVSRTGRVYATNNNDLEAQIQLLLQDPQSPEL